VIYGGGDFKAVAHNDLRLDTKVTVRLIHPHRYYVENSTGSLEENVDERRGDQHDGRYGRGGLVMWLNSEISG